MVLNAVKLNYLKGGIGNIGVGAVKCLQIGAMLPMQKINRFYAINPVSSVF